MSDRGLRFLENWIDRNVVTPALYPLDQEMQKTLVGNCIEDAAQEGISRTEIEEEVGDLAAFLGDMVEHERAAGDPTKDRSV
jgi:hypothetical protein